MKNTIQFNIGLARNDGKENTVPTVASSLRQHGFILTASRIVAGTWQGKPETTLAFEALAALPLCHAECVLAVGASIKRLALDLGQTCIAVQWPDGRGELVPNVGKFDPKQFHAVAEVTSGW